LTWRIRNPNLQKLLRRCFEGG